MTAPTSHLDAARTLGVPVAEISDVAASPAGTVIVTTDGVSYINVPAGKPDSEGKTGLMYLSAPQASYTGSFPVYSLPTDEDAKPATAAAAAVTTATKAADAVSRGALVERAKELGLTINGRTKTETIAQLVAGAENALAAEKANVIAAAEAALEEAIASDDAELIAAAEAALQELKGDVDDGDGAGDPGAGAGGDE